MIGRLHFQNKLQKLSVHMSLSMATFDISTCVKMCMHTTTPQKLAQEITKLQYAYICYANGLKKHAEAYSSIQHALDHVRYNRASNM